MKNTDSGAGTVRADHPIPRSTGLFYFEATIVSRGRDCHISVGLCRSDMLLSRLPGWEEDSWGYHGDDGKSFCCHGEGNSYGPQFSTGDVIGCAVNFSSGECFYTKNGVHLGIAFTGLTGELYPSIGLRSSGEQVRLNFGAQAFVFDIDYYYRQEKHRLYKTVRDEEDDVSSRLQALVSAYLSHNGYIDSARAMALDISSQTNKAVSYPPIDTEASNRQRIRNHVVDGDIDSALMMLEQLFPDVLEQQEVLRFRIKCRKFIEMMRSCAQAQNHVSECQLLQDIPRQLEDDAETEKQELDVTMADVTYPPGIDQDVPSVDKDTKTLLDEAILYGQHLQSLYAAPTNPIFRSGLEEAFSLLAYSDPLNSPLAHLLSPSLRVEIAEDVNRAILISSGKSARSELEEIVASVGTKVGAVKGAEFINVQKDFLRDI